MFKQLLVLLSVLVIVITADRPHPEDAKQAIADLQAAGIDKKYALELFHIEHKMNQGAAKANGDKEKIKKLTEEYNKAKTSAQIRKELAKLGMEKKYIDEFVAMDDEHEKKYAELAKDPVGLKKALDVYKAKVGAFMNKLPMKQHSILNTWFDMHEAELNKNN
ncbi:hypothetical protein CRE_07084 [Caenorhabditis remanei]|uniref:SXP/RAL-2 family protein Ani s 5-like cation-binding domain-containing protein n=1 Tax=Caenorhabditis remanei TaxID=31234 RepID=E3NKQ1_CAERE|nr:hypothetical protein CRE_07084 [Caenorhabditis remanei]